MRGITRDEHTARAIAVCQAEAQFPETDIFKGDIDRRADSLFEEGAEIEIIPRRSRRNRRMEEPVAIQIDAAKELPIALQLWIDRIEDGLFAIDGQLFIKLLRVKDKQGHQPVMRVNGLGNAGCRAHGRARPVTAHQIARRQRALAGSFCLRDGDCNTIFILGECGKAPARQQSDMVIRHRACP